VGRGQRRGLSFRIFRAARSDFCVGVGKRGLCPLDKRGLFGNLGLILSFLGLALLAKSGDKRGLLGDFCPVVGFVGLALLTSAV
jgi:hypothetical protein